MYGALVCTNNLTRILTFFKKDFNIIKNCFLILTQVKIFHSIHESNYWEEQTYDISGTTILAKIFSTS